MENINKKMLVIGSAAIILIAMVIAYGLYSNSTQPTTGNNTAGMPIVPETQPERQGPFPTITKEEINPAEKIVVPEIGQQTAPDVAAPVNVQAAAPGLTSKDRTFNIRAEKNQFDPPTIIANVGDTIRLNFTAVDKTYDFILPDYGMVQTAGKGQTALVMFQVWTTGKFTFYCKLCGGLDSTAVGYVIVAP